ncbi:MAG: hypothetical protein U5P41_16150 [Gammaproteobacteria bacterium]|nr:hypothetical protein [Gammaproteobacteria bacterium]
MEVSELLTGIAGRRHETEPDAAAAAAANMSAGHEFAIEASGNVPGASHSGWQRLIKGELPIQTDSVALRMLLQRVRSNLEKDPSQQTRLAGAQALRQFFIKNQQLLKREIDMLAADESTYSERAETAEQRRLPACRRNPLPSGSNSSAGVASGYAGRRPADDDRAGPPVNRQQADRRQQAGRGTNPAAILCQASKPSGK